MPLRITEKTFEINFVRYYQQQSNLVWVGTSLQEERGVGWDCGIVHKLAPSSMISYFQFKRPFGIEPRPHNMFKFRFKINTNVTRDQHRILTYLASSKPNSVFYALPCLNQMSDLCTDPFPTELYALLDINQPEFGRINMNQPHEIEIDNVSITNRFIPNVATLSSEEHQKVKIIPAAKLVQKNLSGLTRNEFIELIKNSDKLDLGKSSKRLNLLIQL
ncbi:Uncharacterised protein [Candidatus Gugararchaeum adminiculabundum]|nr:Uncharacterised protein [Candidatus Gugararchaeum adminiculabundum]